LAQAGPSAKAVGQKQASSGQVSAALSTVSQAARVAQASSEPWRGRRLAQVNPAKTEKPSVKALKSAGLMGVEYRDFHKDCDGWNPGEATSDIFIFHYSRIYFSHWWGIYFSHRP
jgi:hypothetical protein